MKIPEIKQNLSLNTVLSHYNLKPDNNNRLHCPWHDDKTPSLQIYPKTNTWTCFSSKCNAGSGDVIDFIMKYEVISKYEAIQKAIALIPLAQSIKPKTESEQTPNNFTDNEQPTTNNIATRTEVLTKAFNYFKAGLSGKSRQTLEYIESRGLDKTKLEIGYNSGQMHHRENRQYIESYVKYHILAISEAKGKTEKCYTVWAKYCIIFALRNKQNQITGLYGRSTINNNENKHFYLKDRSGLYPSYPKETTTKLILTESIIDAATLLQISGITKEYEILACYGTNGLTEEHKQAIIELKHLQEIIFAFDNDEAGSKAVEKYTQELKIINENLKISKIELPCKDVNETFISHEPTVFMHLLEQRKILFSDEKTNKKEKSQTGSPSNQHHIATSPLPKFNATNHEALTYETTELHVTVLGGIRISGLERMKVTLKIQIKNSHYDPLRQYLDLYNNEQLTRLIRTVNEQFEVKTETIRQAALGLIEELEHYRISRISLLQPLQPKAPELSPRDMTEGENYLLNPKLMRSTMEDLGKTGIVGEQHNRAIMYLVFLSRITEEPLHIISFGASGSGKTHLQEKIGILLPEQDKLEITTLSGNALYYFKHDEIRHKVLLIEDMDGAQEVLYPLRELQTKQKITKTVSLKDSQNNIKTITFTVHGPVCIAGCTTKIRVYEDNANRSLLIYIDSSREQDERIMTYQRDESAGKINKAEEKKYQLLLRNVQQMLKPLKVVNPYAPHLKIPPGVFKKRRSNWLYLRFIEIITLYHQYQREQKTNNETGEIYIETTLEDIAWANKLLKNVLLRKADELSEPARNFFEYLKKWLKENKMEQFKNKDIRDGLQVTASCLKRYLPELLNCGHIKITSGNKTKGYTYEITSYEEYEKLKNSINNLLDNLLDELKKKEEKNKNTVVCLV
ncbi:MAG: toprim domain-containing protein [Bacteroidales bacterium]|jgi:DNA primase catalytic core